MANTFKFGNGNWAVKKDSVLAYNDENNNFKPLPFDFTRDTIGTYVDSDGLIKTAARGEARIDYLDNANGHLLLEPSRTNKATYSEAFDNSYWTKSDATVVSGFAAPDGSNNAFKLVEGTSNSLHFVRCDYIITTDGGNIAASVFVKADTRTQFTLQENAYTGDYVTVDLASETVISTDVSSANLTKLTNGWFRVDIVSAGNPSTRWRLQTTLNGTSTYTGDGTSGLYIWGFQLEDNVSYATSYIPTNGSSVTRAADSCTGAGNSEVFNDSEGVLFAEIAALADDLTYRSISLGDSSGGDVNLFYSNTSNTIVANNTGGSSITEQLSDITRFNKFGFKYKANDFALWVNGSEAGTDTSGTTADTLSELNFDNGLGGSKWYGKVKEIRVYNTALTNAELITLTT